MDTVKLETIDRFRGDYEFLSNFHEKPVCYGGLVYGSAEAAFQAQKTLNQTERRKFTSLSPSDAKRMGRRVKLRPDWEDVKIREMNKILSAKFRQDHSLARMLLATGNANLVESNNWNDTFWGVCNGSGRNELGKALMALRHKLRAERALPFKILALEMNLTSGHIVCEQVTLYHAYITGTLEDASNILKERLVSRKNDLQQAHPDWTAYNAIAFACEDMISRTDVGYQMLAESCIEPYSF